MYCEYCGKKSDGTSKFCTSCGKPLSNKEVPKEEPITYKPKKQRRGPSIPATIGIVVIVGAVVWGTYSSSKNDTAIQTANTALTTANSNDTSEATSQVIQQYKDAYNNATDDATKLTILTNLALTYDSSGDSVNALSTYKQALGYAPQGSSDYYLILGEIAQLKIDPATAKSDLEQAYKLNPNDYQINNELALFYFDSDNSWTSYDDLPKALQYMKVAYGLEKNDATAENLAMIYYYNKDYQQTINLLLPLNLTNHPIAALYLGYAYEQENDSTNAKYYFQKAISLGDQVSQDVNDYINSN